jgi:hypothetical protein
LWLSLRSLVLAGELQSHRGGRDSFAVRAAQPQEAFRKGRYFERFALFQKASCAFGTPIASNRGYPGDFAILLLVLGGYFTTSPFRQRKKCGILRQLQMHGIWEERAAA